MKVRAGSFSIDHNLAHYAAINRGALFLAYKAAAVEFDASFYAVQALELAPGGKAFDRAYKSLRKFGSAPEIIANLVIAAAKNGERDPARLYIQALKGFGISDRTMPTVGVGPDLRVPIDALVTQSA